MKIFDKAEWRYHDIEHFGKEIEWEVELYYLKAYEGKEIRGTMELKVEGGIGIINTLLVGHQLLRQGVGKALIHEAEEITKKQNGHKMFLTTGKDWHAVAFYKAMGYTQTGELKNHYFNIDFIELSKFI